jgi:ribosome-binding protein aMBF1 (putative translation factor)
MPFPGRVKISQTMKPLTHYMEKSGMSLEELVAGSGLDTKVVRAIASGNYTASPSERQRLASVLGILAEDVAWEHSVPVEHLYGHGPQFGRSP